MANDLNIFDRGEVALASLTKHFAALLEQSKELSSAYSLAEPFPHLIIDNFLPTSIIENIYADFPASDSPAWVRLPTEDQKGKMATRDECDLPPSIRALIFELNSGLFLRFLERLTGIPELIADTKLAGGGLHSIQSGGKLSVHVDFSHHPSNGLSRRLNFLLYLNKDWKEEWGGHFELWNWTKDNKSAVAKILPIFNRAVIFSTTPTSWHGHPEPLACPKSNSRKSIALYYFSNGRPAAEDFPHNTLFKTRPGDKTTIGNMIVRTASGGLAQNLLPPLFYRMLRRIWNKRFTAAK